MTPYEITKSLVLAMIANEAFSVERIAALINRSPFSGDLALIVEGTSTEGSRAAAVAEILCS